MQPITNIYIYCKKINVSTYIFKFKIFLKKAYIYLQTHINIYILFSISYKYNLNAIYTHPIF